MTHNLYDILMKNFNKTKMCALCHCLLKMDKKQVHHSSYSLNLFVCNYFQKMAIKRILYDDNEIQGIAKRIILKIDSYKKKIHSCISPMCAQYYLDTKEIF